MNENSNISAELVARTNAILRKMEGNWKKLNSNSVRFSSAKRTQDGSGLNTDVANDNHAKNIEGQNTCSINNAEDDKNKESIASKTSDSKQKVRHKVHKKKKMSYLNRRLIKLEAELHALQKSKIETISKSTFRRSYDDIPMIDVECSSPYKSSYCPSSRRLNDYSTRTVILEKQGNESGRVVAKDRSRNDPFSGIECKNSPYKSKSLPSRRMLGVSNGVTLTEQIIETERIVNNGFRTARDIDDKIELLRRYKIEKNVSSNLAVNEKDMRNTENFQLLKQLEEKLSNLILEHQEKCLKPQKINVDAKENVGLVSVNQGDHKISLKKKLMSQRLPDINIFPEVETVSSLAHSIAPYATLPAEDIEKPISSLSLEKRDSFESILREYVEAGMAPQCVRSDIGVQTDILSKPSRVSSDSVIHEKFNLRTEALKRKEELLGETVEDMVNRVRESGKKCKQYSARAKKKLDSVPKRRIEHKTDNQAFPSRLVINSGKSIPKASVEEYQSDFEIESLQSDEVEKKIMDQNVISNPNAYSSNIVSVTSLSDDISVGSSPRSPKVMTIARLSAGPVSPLQDTKVQSPTSSLSISDRSLKDVRHSNFLAKMNGDGVAQNHTVAESKTHRVNCLKPGPVSSLVDPKLHSSTSSLSTSDRSPKDIADFQANRIRMSGDGLAHNHTVAGSTAKWLSCLEPGPVSPLVVHSSKSSFLISDRSPKDIADFEAPRIGLREVGVAQNHTVPGSEPHRVNCLEPKKSGQCANTLYILSNGRYVPLDPTQAPVVNIIVPEIVVKLSDSASHSKVTPASVEPKIDQIMQTDEGFGTITSTDTCSVIGKLNENCERTQLLLDRMERKSLQTPLGRRDKGHRNILDYLQKCNRSDYLATSGTNLVPRRSKNGRLYSYSWKEKNSIANKCHQKSYEGDSSISEGECGQDNSCKSIGEAISSEGR